MIFREAFHRLISGALGLEPYPDTVPQEARLPAAGYLLTSPVQAARTLEGGITLQSHNWQVDLYATRRTQLDELANRLAALDNTTTTEFQRVTVLDARDAKSEGGSQLRAIVEIQTTNRRNRA
ncbi:hypothetical protein [Aeromonas caviae]|uniref:hypothetical protein n=1 Tax=Aeromonas caviae TaxID=648 RepID=UPI0029D59EF2|nr:hypothetical protein [Aeromonas caviae]MDX7704733.1 hypothetical protein [Aeromonas caviae]MDX7793251.1 hypothetical protein [Aeromonas caviae]